MLSRKGALRRRLPAVFCLSLMALFSLGCGGGSDTVPEGMEDNNGSFDVCDTSDIAGWAWDLDAKAAVKVDIYVVEKDTDGKEKDRLLTTVAANKYRVDLTYKDRKYGFSYKTTADLKPGTKIHVKIHGSNIVLEGSPRELKQR